MSGDLSDRQAAAGRQGAAFETTVETLLQIEGWRIIDRKWRHPEFDVEVDIVAAHPTTGAEWWIECKGSWEGSRPGLKRTDTLKKALFNGAMLALADDRKPYMIVASHPPADGTAGTKWLERAKGIYVDEVRYLTFTTPGASV
jgi:Holliday junction resolvase-like predicted endonuclease